jgi:hypothetical protein
MAISGVRIAAFQCPSDDRAGEVRDPGGGGALLYATNYGFNMGTWFVFDPTTNTGGDGAFFPNSNLPLAQFADGTSNTLLAGEVKAWTAYSRNGGLSSTEMPANADAAQVNAGPDKKDTGHTEWPDGRVHQHGHHRRNDAQHVCAVHLQRRSGRRRLQLLARGKGRA